MRGDRGAWRARAVALSTACLAGCSLIYDSDVFITEDAAPIDAETVVDAAPPSPDVDPGSLTLVRLDPDEVLEGAGAGRAIPIVIHGDSIAAIAEVTLDGGGFDAQSVDVTVSGDGKMAAFEIALPVREDLGEGATEEITVTVSQGAGVEMSLPLTLRGLPELDWDVAGTLDTGDIAARYSRVAITESMTLTGMAPARFVATAELTVDAMIDGSGGDASGVTAGAAGPGGCDGGAVESPGLCGLGGGRGGGTASGGGGGGHADVGTGGSGGNPGAGGVATGNQELVPLSDEGGNGGGGGGPPTALGVAGAGGGGGGVVELTSLGALTIGANAQVDASGGAGDGGGNLCDVLDQHGGGGGGGAGGAVLVRSAGTLTDDAGVARLSVAKGAKGNDDCNAGGDGSLGRVRVDVPNALATPAFAGTGLYRGPVPAPDTDAIVRDAALMLTVFGDIDGQYVVQRDGGSPESLTVGASRRATVEVTLSPGLNRVCAIVRAGVNINSPEGSNCVSVAFISR